VDGGKDASAREIVFPEDQSESNVNSVFLYMPGHYDLLY